MDGRDIFEIEDGGKTAGMMSYFFILGWSLAYFGYHQANKTNLSSFHLRQTLLLFTSFLSVRFGMNLFLGRVWLSDGLFSLNNATHLLDITFVICWVIGLIGAINGEQKAIPFLGKPAQNLFSNI